MNVLELPAALHSLIALTKRHAQDVDKLLQLAAGLL